MAKKEVKTDLWVARQLDDSKIKYDPQCICVVVYEGSYSAAKKQVWLSV